MNVLGQIYFMDMFLGGEFTTYGADVVSMSELEPDQREDPMSRVFPKVGVRLIVQRGYHSCFFLSFFTLILIVIFFMIGLLPKIFFTP